MINKRGLSDLTSNVLIMLLTISLASLLFGTITNFLDNPALSPEYSCPNINFKAPINLITACYNETTAETQLLLSRKPTNINVNNLNFVINSESGSESYNCGFSCGSCKILTEDSVERYYLSSNKGDEISLYFNNCLLGTQEITMC